MSDFDPTDADRLLRTTKQVRKRLDLGEREPCLVVLRRTWAGGRPVTFARLHHPGSRYELTGHYVPPGTRSAGGGISELE